MPRTELLGGHTLRTAVCLGCSFAQQPGCPPPQARLHGRPLICVQEASPAGRPVRPGTDIRQDCRASPCALDAGRTQTNHTSSPHGEPTVCMRAPAGRGQCAQQCVRTHALPQRIWAGGLASRLAAGCARQQVRPETLCRGPDALRRGVPLPALAQVCHAQHLQGVPAIWPGRLGAGRSSLLAPAAACASQSVQVGVQRWAHGEGAWRWRLSR